MSSIIILGSEHHNTVGTIRCFTDKGIQVAAFICGVKTSYIRKMRYLKEIKYFEDCESAIIELSKEKYHGAIVINCTDESALMLDKYKKDLGFKVSFFHTQDPKGIKYYMDKSVQAKIAASININIPKSWSVTSDVNAECFPCIIKPLATINGGKHIEICHNINEYNQAVNSFETCPVTVQEFIEKEEEIVLLGSVIGDEVIIPGYVHKIREFQGGTNYSIVYPTNALPYEIVYKTKRLLHKMNYEGLFGVEYIRKGDAYYFVEVNLRVDATTYALAVAGVNLPYIFYLYKTNQDYKKESGNPIASIHSEVEIRDLYNAVVKNKMCICTWYRQFMTSECKYYYRKGEIWFFLSALWGTFVHHIKDK